MFGNNNFFCDTTRRTLENAILEKNVSEHDIIQHTQIIIKNYFFFVCHKRGWDMELK